jgi:YfiH family protein
MMNKTPFDYIVPDWPAPANVSAVITLRSCGPTQPPYDKFNLAMHVGDDPNQVIANRSLLRKELNLTLEPLWLDQVHGKEIVYAPSSQRLPSADGAYTNTEGQACAILTADCMPVLLCNQQGTQVAAVHAGWRGLCDGIISKALQQFSANDSVMAYLGPAISAQYFEVGAEVRSAFLSKVTASDEKELVKKAFVETKNEHYLADLYALARAELARRGVSQVYGGEFCSYSQSAWFYSYRREKICGRNASLIWLKSS